MKNKPDLKVKGGPIVMANKLLINVGEQRRSWLQKVKEVSGEDVSTIVRVLIDQASVEDPESFATKLSKVKLKMKLADIEKRETELHNEKIALTQQLQDGGLREVAGA